MRVIAFDLDDTLFYEWRFVASAAAFISKYLENRFAESFQNERRQMVKAILEGHNHFDVLETMLSERDVLKTLPMKDIVALCRSHVPNLKPAPGALSLLKYIKDRGDFLCLITDGRSTTQRNKIKSLGLDEYFSQENIFVSEETGYEKKTGFPFKKIMNRYLYAEEYVYIGDNVEKDVDAPRKSGWKTIIVTNRGYNIHRQSSGDAPEPDFYVRSLKEISRILYCFK